VLVRLCDLDGPTEKTSKKLSGPVYSE
jgi:hypothetical protein